MEILHGKRREQRILIPTTEEEKSNFGSWTAWVKIWIARLIIGMTFWAPSPLFLYVSLFPIGSTSLEVNKEW